MISQKERERLVEMYKNEPLYAAGTVIKCAACLLILAGLAVIGTSGEPIERTIIQASPSDHASEVGMATEYVRPEPSTVRGPL